MGMEMKMEKEMALAMGWAEFIVAKVVWALFHQSSVKIAT